MCMFSSPSTPEVPTVEAPPETPKAVSAATQQARDDSRKQALLASGRSGDIVTGNYGLAGTAVTTQAKTILGI